MRRNNRSVNSVSKRFCSGSRQTMAQDNDDRSSAVKSLPEPVKPDTDRKLYRSLCLNNGLRVLLISDTFTRSKEERTATNEDDDETDDAGEEKMAAAAMAVGCGNFSDPDRLPGLAHFVEHMVSMGTRKYPEENGFDVFVKNSGGSWNAHTDCEETVFYFDVNTVHMHQALDRFAQLFIAPLMRVESMQRERQAVENEFNDALPNDSNRRDQLLSCIARDGHPMSRFMWGNLHSLSSAGSSLSDEEINAAVHKFWRECYLANNMCLVVQADQSLDLLQDWVVPLFSSIRHSAAPRPNFADNGAPWDMAKFNRFYKVVSVKDRHYLTLTWQLPSLVDRYRSKPLSYLSWLIGHEGHGSILAYLKKRNWAVLLESGNAEGGFEHNSTCSSFYVAVKLTDSGLANLRDVVCSIWAYVTMLQRVGPQERIHREIERVDNMCFQYMEESSPQDWVQSLASNMLVYAPKEYIRGGFIALDYDRDLIQSCVENMTPESCNVMLSSKTFSDTGVCDQTEFWFGTKYTSTGIPEAWLNYDMSEVASCFHLPKENQFIADNVSLLAAPEKAALYPQCILEEPGGELFYRFDSKFQLPRAFILLYLRSNLAQQSAYNSSLLDLLNGMLSFALTEDIYPASVARLNHSLQPTQSGYEIRVDGFNDKLHHILYLIVDYITNFEQKVMNAELFNVIKQDLHKSYMNWMLDAPKLGRDLRLSVVKQHHWMHSEKNSALLYATESSLLEFVRLLRSSLYIQVLIQGNIEQTQAVNIFNTVKERLSCRPLLKQELVEMRVNQLPDSDKYVRVASFNENSTNSCVSNLYQGRQATIASSCVTELLMYLMEEPAFDFLRTQEQLGYHVTSKMMCIFGVLSVVVSVHFHADKYTPEHVDDKIETFLKKFEKHLLELSSDEFDTVCESLILNKQCGDVSLEEEVYRNWREIVSGQYKFDRLSKEVVILSHTCREQVLEKFRSLLMSSNSSTDRRKLSVQVVGFSANSSAPAGTVLNSSQAVSAPCDANGQSAGSPRFLVGQYPELSSWIANVSQFKSTLPIYPVFKVVD